MIQRSYEYGRTQQHIRANAEGWQWMKDACDRAEASKKAPYPWNPPLHQSESVMINHAKFYICLYETASESAKHLLHSSTHMSDAGRHL